MIRQNPLLIALASLIFATLACNAFAGNVEPALELPPPSILDLTSTPNGEIGGPIQLAPTATLPNTQPPLEETGGSPIVRVLVDLNIRSGPGVQYDRVGFLLANETVPILGQDPNSGWWKIACPTSVTIVTECWVSGGAQYSQGVNAEGVPIAAAPPTPTPEPTQVPTSEPEELSQSAVASNNGRLVYADSVGVWRIDLDLSANPPIAADPVQITAATDVNQVLISPDGRHVAYLTGSFEANSLHVIDIDGANGRLLIQSTNLNVSRNIDTSEAVLLINQLQWLANSQSIAFNTDLVSQIGPGIISQEDLWTASLAGEIRERFGTGELGGYFTISDQNQVLAGGAEKIVRANLNGSGREELIAFELVNTASEYFYYPRPQWMANDRRAFVAVPNREQFSAGANFTLWEMGAAEPAEALTTVPGNILFGDVQWSPTGSRVAYVASQVGTGALPTLSLATANGGSPVPYATDAQLSFYSWRRDGNAFLFAGSDFFGIGQLNAAPIQIVVSEQTVEMQWLDNVSFLVASGRSGAWQLKSSNMTGSIQPIVTLNTSFPSFDSWAP